MCVDTRLFLLLRDVEPRRPPRPRRRSLLRRLRWRHSRRNRGRGLWRLGLTLPAATAASLRRCVLGGLLGLFTLFLLDIGIFGLLILLLLLFLLLILVVRVRVVVGEEVLELLQAQLPVLWGVNSKATMPMLLKIIPVN